MLNLSRDGGRGWISLALRTLAAVLICIAPAPPSAAEELPVLSPEQELLGEALVTGAGVMGELFGGREQRPAGVLHGEPREWRVLWKKPGEYVVGGTITGNFDDDADSELLIDLGTELAVLNLDGTLQQSGIPRWHWPSTGVVYDFDGDGSDDLLTDDGVYGLNGAELGRLPGLPIGTTVLAGDFDGDGSTDLLLRGKRQDAAREAPFIIVGRQGAVLAEFEPIFGAFGDINGDGRDEYVAQLADFSAYTYRGMDGARGIIKLASPSDYTQKPAFCADLNQDGTDEVITGFGRLFDPVSGLSRQLQPVPGYLFMYLDGPFFKNTVSYRQADGSMALAALPVRLVKQEHMWADSIGVWNAAGELIYAERFPGTPFHLRVGTFAGHDHLIVESRYNYYIWP